MTENSQEQVTYIPTKDGKYLQPEGNIIKKEYNSWYLYFSLVTAYLVILTGGAGFSWTSPVLPKLLSNSTTINPLGAPISTIDISVLVGFTFFFSLFGPLVGPFISDLLGKKWAIYIGGLGMFIGNTIIAFSTKFIFLVIGRSIFFVCFGACLAIVAIYTTEVCENHNRARFGCLMGVFPPVGNLYTYVLGPQFTFKMFTLVMSIPLIIFLILFYFAPESPVYLLSKGREEDCIKTLKKLRSNKNNEELKNDYNEIDATIKARTGRKKSSLKTIFKNREGRIGLVIGCIPITLQIASGVPVLVAFLGPIFNEAGTNLSGETIAIYVGIFKVISFILTTTIVERTGRRPLLLFSSVGVGLSLFTVALFFYLKHIKSPVVPSIQWLPVVAILCYIVSYSSGLGPIPPSLLGELFTPEFRSTAVSFMLTIFGLVVFLLTAGFPILSAYAGVHTCIFLFSFNCAIGSISIYFLVPETRGKSILEIQDIFKNYKFGFKRF